MKQVTARVPLAPRYRPEVIEPAFDDPDAVLGLVQDGGPYPNLAGMAGYGGFKMSTMPWFRTLMASESGQGVPGAGLVLENRIFIETARRVFDSEVVRPKAVTLNVMTPQGNGGAHLDTARYRGSFPTSSWLLSVMGSSGLLIAGRCGYRPLVLPRNGRRLRVLAARARNGIRGDSPTIRQHCVGRGQRLHASPDPRIWRSLEVHRRAAVYANLVHSR